MQVNPVTQNRVWQVVEALNVNATLQPGLLDPRAWRIHSTSSYIATPNYAPKPGAFTCDMASTTKMLLDYIISRIVFEQGVGEKLPLTAEVAIECFKRDKAWANESFGEELCKLISSASQPQTGLATLRLFLEANPLMLDLNSYRQQMIYLSSNAAASLLRAWAQERIGGIEKLQELVREAAPSLILTESVEMGHHWMQGNSNTGNPAEIAFWLQNLLMKPDLQLWEREW